MLDSSAKSSIFTAETTLEATDSDPRLQILRRAASAVSRNDEATVSKIVTRSSTVTTLQTRSQLRKLSSSAPQTQPLNLYFG